MKKYIFLSLFVLSFALVGCNEKEFLSTLPQGTIMEEVLNSAEGTDMLINAAYSALMGPSPTNRIHWYPVTNWIYGEVRADNAYKGGGGTTDGAECHLMEIMDVDATNSFVDGKWFDLYKSVRRCNVALKVLNTCTPQEVPELEIKKAEMRVLRAHFYFELSRLFNKIVWITEDVADEDYDRLPNDEYTRDEILGMIAKEFEDAAAVLPASQNLVGRVNKYIAKAYAAKVYLYKAYVQDPSNNALKSINATDLNKCVALCDEVISTGKYGLLDDFQQLDLVEYENAKESIFAIQFSMEDGSKSHGRINWSALLNAPQGPYSGDGFFLPSQDLINAYKTDANGLPLLDGSFQNEDYDVIEVLADGKTAINNNISSPVDPRLDFVVGRPNVRWKTYTAGTCQINWIRHTGDYGFHCAKRFYVSPDDPHILNAWPWGASQLNWQIIRYADVLLWKAEALVELGRQDEARPLINQIRNRAKNSAWVTAWDGTGKENSPNFDGFASNYKIEEYPAEGWTQDYARKAVRFEARLEKALEGERFFDLVRWGIASDTMNQYFKCEQDIRTYYSTSKFTAGKDEYFPITNAQQKYSHDSYTQNPGYSAFK